MKYFPKLKFQFLILIKNNNILITNSKLSFLIKSFKVKEIMIKRTNILKKVIQLSKGFVQNRFLFSNQQTKDQVKTQNNELLGNSNKVSSIPSLKQFMKQNTQVKQNDNNQDNILGEDVLIRSYQELQSNFSIDEQQQQTSTSSLMTPLKYHIQTYGCQMNVNDTQIIRSILTSTPHLFNPEEASTPEQANIVFLNTCAIRESAESKIHTRIKQLKNVKNIKVLGVLGCMAERLKDKMFTNGVNIICGPDAYRDLPKLVQTVVGKDFKSNEMNVQLSVQQTYADITPVRKNVSTISSFLSIMRGCNNMCSFCIVPFVRGRQRSRDVDTILKQIDQLQSQGVKQITFLGQNVNSYHDTSKTDIASNHQNSEGFSEMFKLRSNPGYRFGQLLQIAAKSFPDLRFRFTSPHPKDFPDEVLQKIATYDNICKYIHLPVQSGNTQMLFKMRRNHTRQAYLNLVKRMKSMIPTLTLSTDLICGFCGQTDEQFQDSISLLEEVKYQNAFLFAYSMRQKTHAHRNYQDDVPHQIKMARLQKMIKTFTEVQRPLNEVQINKNHLLLIENTSKKSSSNWIGKTDNFKKGVIPKGNMPIFKNGEFIGQRQIKLGDYVAVNVESVAARSLNCIPLAIVDKLSDYFKYQSKLINLKSKVSNQLSA